MIVLDLLDTLNDGKNRSYDPFTLQIVLAFSVLTMYIKIFYFLRIFKRTAALVRLIIETTKDMTYFLIILLLGILAIGHWYYIFAFQDGDNEITGNYYYEAFLVAYKFSFGDFSTTYSFKPLFPDS